MKKLFILIYSILSLSVYGQLAVGTVRKSIVTDTNGNVINTPVSFSNNVSIVTTPTQPTHIARYVDVTNATTAAAATLTTALTNAANTWTAQQTMNGGVVIAPTKNFQGGTNTVNMIEAYGTIFMGAPDTTTARFGVINKNTGEGTAWTYSTNAANSAKITILQDGIYSGTASIGDENSLGDDASVYWTLNADSTTTHFDPHTHSMGTTNLASCYIPNPSLGGGTPIASASFVSFLPSNSVVRVQTLASPAVPDNNRMIFQQIMRK